MKRCLVFVICLLALAQFTAAQSYYVVKFPDDQTVYGCGVSADTIFPVISQNNFCNFGIGISVHDQVYASTGGGGCTKIVRRFRLLYWCDYDPAYTPTVIPNPTISGIGPTVTATPANHGYLEYSQIINILDAENPVFTDCPASPVTFCDYSANDPAQYNNGYGNLCEGAVQLQITATDACSGSNMLLGYLLYLDLNSDGSMETFVGSSMPGAWPIETTVSGNLLTGKVKFQPGQGLPYGTHKIKWIAKDKCGNETVCEYLFVVKDCSPPTAVCMNGLSANIGPDGSVTLNESNFLLYTTDNCTPVDQIQLGIVKTTQSAGVFPAGSHSVSFDCSELGQQEVQVWVKDAQQNAGYCQTYVIVDDHFGSCAPASLVGGTILTAQNKPLPGASIQLAQHNQVVSSATANAEGVFQFASIPAGCHYLFTPTHPAPAAAGINTLDALLIAAHLYEQMPLSPPLNLLAADVDRSGDLTDADIEALLQVVLGKNAQFPDADTWQFLPANTPFDNPQNPWAAAIPTSIGACLSSLMSVQPDFIAIKTGDVNGSAEPSLASAPADRAEQPAVSFYTGNVQFNAGETVTVPLITPDLDGIAGFQFTLEYNPEYLALQGWTEALVPEKWIAHFPEAHLLTATWHNSALLSAAGKNLRQTALTLEFTALQAGRLSDVLSMHSARTAAEVYTTQLGTLGATLDFDRRTRNTPALLQASPNPSSGAFSARFYLPEGGAYRLALVDARGLALSDVQGEAPAGYQEVWLDPGAHKGLFFIRLQSGDSVEIRRIVVE